MPILKVAFEMDDYGVTELVVYRKVKQVGIGKYGSLRYMDGRTYKPTLRRLRMWTALATSFELTSLSYEGAQLSLKFDKE